jgi:hypothetical protein
MVAVATPAGTAARSTRPAIAALAMNPRFSFWIIFLLRTSYFYKEATLLQCNYVMRRGYIKLSITFRIFNYSVKGIAQPEHMLATDGSEAVAVKMRPSHLALHGRARAQASARAPVV